MILIKREEKDNKQVLLTIRVEQAEWTAALAKVYQDNSAYLPVEGYQPGQAPREAIEKAFGEDALYQEAVNETYPVALVEAIRREELTVAGAPKLEVLSIGPEGYTFTALIDPYPEVKLGQYKGLTVTAKSVELSDDDMSAALADFCQRHLTEEYPLRAAMGDEVTLDFEGFVDGVPFEGGKAESYPLVLGSGMFIPGFEEQVAGICPEEERDIAVTFPTQYAPELAGKDAVFHIVAHKIVRRSMPALTEEFAAAQGYESLSHLRQTVYADALRQKELQTREQTADELVAQVLEQMQVQIPESMVQSQLDGLMKELEAQLAAQGYSMEAYLEAGGMTREALREQVRESALATIRFELAMTEIARLEGIHISDADVDAKYVEMAPMYNMTPEQMRRSLPPERLAHDLRLAKARAVVVNTAKRVNG